MNKETKTIAQQIKWDFKANGSLAIKNKNGNVIYYEISTGWGKWEYDSKGNELYFENSDGYWAKFERDSYGNIIYFEDSDGEIRDNRPKPC